MGKCVPILFDSDSGEIDQKGCAYVHVFSCIRCQCKQVLKYIYCLRMMHDLLRDHYFISCASPYLPLDQSSRHTCPVFCKCLFAWIFLSTNKPTIESATERQHGVEDFEKSFFYISFCSVSSCRQGDTDFRQLFRKEQLFFGKKLCSFIATRTTSLVADRQRASTDITDGLCDCEAARI